MPVWPPRIIQKLWASWFKIPISHRGILVIALPTLCTLVTLGLWVWSRHSTQTTIQQIMAITSLLSFLGAVYLFRQLEQELRNRERQLFHSKTII
ncbi:MAG: hypothetical protein WCD18_00170, partial [Thermosynechococcaceae cyanobacterium]